MEVAPAFGGYPRLEKISAFHVTQLKSYPYTKKNETSIPALYTLGIYSYDTLKRYNVNAKEKMT